MRLSPFGLRLVAATALLALPLAACTDDDPAPTPTTEPTPTESTTSAAPEGPQSSAELVLAPGAMGPVDVGMSRADAEQTGLFDFDVETAAECTVAIQWKERFTGADVLAGQDGTIVALGSRSADGPRTDQGLGVGSTFGELIETYGGDLSAPEAAGYQQVGVFVQDGDKWLGFLFGDINDVERANNDPGVKVTFAEATAGEKPTLMRDGC